MPASPDPRPRWLAALLEPLALPGTVLPNRLMMSALTLQYGIDGLISDRHLAFYSTRARGGAGLLFSEQLTASPLSESPFAHCLRAYERRQIPGFQRIAAAMRPFGTRFFAQLFAAGAAGASTMGMSHWAPLRAPSDIPAPGGERPCPLSVDEIGQIVQDFAVSAGNVREGGLHGIEVHGAHGWLVGQFLSPFYNRRSDQYGGSAANRCRIALEIGAAIRAHVGKDFPLGLSLTYDELMGTAGITPNDTLEQLRVLDDAAIFDFFDLSIGSSHQQHFTLGSMAVPHGISLDFAAQARQVVRPATAILASGRITDPEMAGHAVADRKADVVGMARALLADPALLVKAGTTVGPRRRATRCVGANYCVARALGDQPVTCVLNPATGRENEWPELLPARPQLRIAVVGGGPAGLKLAGVAAQRGHRPTVFEGRQTPGGHLAVLARLPTRQAWSDAIEDMVAVLREAGGVLKLGSTASADTVLETAPDVIVVATGSRWIIPRRQDSGTEPTPHHPRLIPLDQAIIGATGGPREPFGRHTLIVDASGTYAPLGLADLLSADGMHITFVTTQSAVGSIAALELDLQHVMPRLSQRAMEALVACQIVGMHGKCVTLESIWGASPRTLQNVDCVVYAETREPNDTLCEELRLRHPSVICIGDALTPRSTAAVIHEAEALARAL